MLPTRSTRSTSRWLALAGLALLLAVVAAAGVLQITLVTVGWGGTPTDGLSRHFDLAKKGRLVSLMSEATNLVPDDTNGVRDIFVIDLRHEKTVRVSVASDGTQGDADSGGGYMSRNGRFITFHSDATTLVPEDTNDAGDVFVHDLKRGETERISVATDGTQANGSSAWPNISKSGRYVAYRSSATNLVPGDTNGASDVFLYDRKKRTTTRVSLTTSGEEPNGDSLRHAISSNGRYVAVLSTSSNVVPGDTNGHSDVFVHDLKKGTTTLASVGLEGEPANGGCFQPFFSNNSRFVVFLSWASNLVPDDGNNVTDVFVFDMKLGATERCSVSSAGEEGNGECFVADLARNGRLVFFDSLATNLVPGDTNDARDVFVQDRKTGKTERLSVSAAGIEGNADSLRPRPTKRGKRVAIYSRADNLVPDDTNGASDVFIIRR